MIKKERDMHHLLADGKPEANCTAQQSDEASTAPPSTSILLPVEVSQKPVYGHHDSPFIFDFTVCIPVGIVTAVHYDPSTRTQFQKPRMSMG
jgi:hypothetical protein